MKRFTVVHKTTGDVVENFTLSTSLTGVVDGVLRGLKDRYDPKVYTIKVTDEERDAAD